MKKTIYKIKNSQFMILYTGSPIHIIKIKVVQVGGRHLRVSFFIGDHPMSINLTEKVASKL
ncbi:hypothetical protein BK723_04070 [Bacillus thuringiensis serovar pondicheriensis]|nr:hypothetical protein BK723_04070 [Bacillus thuringiensis serovar pondicheriensis]